MKKSDFIWIFILLSLTSIIIIPYTRVIFENATASNPYLMGFIKTSILASLGERLVKRIKTGSYFGDPGIFLKFIIWGLLGMVFVVIFKVFAGGVVAAEQANLLPFINNNTFIASLLTAFLISTLMNLFFAPTFMLFHRVTDQYIELSGGNLKKMMHVSINDVVGHIDFVIFFKFVVFKTIPLFWIPAHTITFLLPENYRVLMAAYLSVVLGILLSVSNSVKHKEDK